MKAFLKTAPRLLAIIWICAATTLGTGCLGPKVLSENVTHMPAPDPKIELCLKPGLLADVLVMYDDISTGNEKTKRRAFYLFSNEKRIAHGRRPEFVGLSQANHLQPIPVFKETLLPAPTNELYAVQVTSRHFKLQSRDHSVTEFTLPEYENWLTAKKLFLFPAAVGADAVGLGAVIAISDPELAAQGVEVAARAAH